ncbi:replication-relaxation family protein [Radiobacillus deserti]|nr:replication-relaxation family protein [Radiobacillus deserti]
MNQRQMQILDSLSNLEILTRSQIQTLHNTKSTRNTNFIMQSLKPYTRSIRLKENAYYLNKKGAELTGAKRQFRVNEQLTHKLMRNDAYIYFEPHKWLVEQEVKVMNISVKPDAYFVIGNSRHFLEVDNTQKWNVNVKKMKYYRKLKETNAFQQKYGSFPSIVWVIKHESRKDKLMKVADELELNINVYVHDEII